MTEAAHSPENGSPQCVDGTMKPPSAVDTSGSASSDEKLECHTVEVAPDESDCKEAEEPTKELAADETDTETEDEGDFWIASRPASCIEPPKAEETQKEENGDSPMRRRSSVTMRKISDVAVELKNVVVGGAQDFVKDSYELAVGIKEGMEITVEDTIALKAKLVSSTQATLAARGEGFIGMLSGRSGRNSLSSSPERAAISSSAAEEVAEVHSPRPSLNPLEALSKGLRANLGLQEQQDADLALAIALQEGSVEAVQVDRVAPSLDDLADTNNAMDQMLQSMRVATGEPISPSNYKPSWASSVDTSQLGSSPRSRPPTDVLERLLNGDDICQSKETAPQVPRASTSWKAQTSVAKAASASVARVGQFARSLARFAPQRKTASSQVSSPTSNSPPSKARGSEEPSREQRTEESVEELKDSSSSCLNNAESAEEDSPTRRNSNSAVMGALKASQKISLATQAMSSGLLRQASGISGKLAAATRGRKGEQEKAKDERRRSVDSRHSNSDVEDSIFAICSDEDDDMFTDEAFENHTGTTNGKSEARRHSSGFKEFEEFSDNRPSDQVGSERQGATTADVIADSKVEARLEAPNDRTGKPQQSRSPSRRAKSPKNTGLQATTDAYGGNSENSSVYYDEEDAEEEERVLDEEVDPSDDDAVEQGAQRTLDLQKH